MGSQDMRQSEEYLSLIYNDNKHFHLEAWKMMKAQKEQIELLTQQVNQMSQMLQFMAAKMGMAPSQAEQSAMAAYDTSEKTRN